MQKKLIYSVLFILNSLLSFEATAQDSAPSVVAQKLTASHIEHELQLSGTIAAQHNSRLSVSVSALVKERHVDIGDRVKKGDLLLTLDDEVARQESTRVNALLNLAKTAKAEAQRLLEEAQQMQNRSGISETEVKTRENNTHVMTAQYNEAVAAAKIAEAQLARHRLLAPFNGIISQRDAELGQWLQPGSATFTLVSEDELFLDLQLPQEYAKDISNISNIHVTPGTQTNINIPANVAALVPVGNAARTFLLRVKPEQGQDTLYPGISATATLLFKRDQQATLLPRDALLRNIDGNYSVFVVENGVVTRRSIKLGDSYRGDYWVLDGLQEGEFVVVRGNELLESGQNVTVTLSAVETL